MPSPVPTDRRSLSQAAGDAYLAGWRAIWLLGALLLVSIFAQVDRILPFILAESIKSDLRLSDTQVGLINGLAFALCYALLSLPLARLADRGSPRRVLVMCILLWSMMTAMGGMATSFLFLAMTRLGVAVGEAGAIPSAHALIARWIRPDRRGTAIGIFSMGIPLGTMAGFGIGGAVGDAYGWRTALVSAGAIGGIVALLTFVAAGPARAPRRESIEAQSYLASSLTLLSSPAFRWLFCAAVTIGFAAAPFYAFAASFLIRTHGFTTGEAGLVFGLLQGGLGIAGTLLGGRGFDRAARAGKRHLQRPAFFFALAGVALVAALLVPQAWIAITLMTPAMFAFAFILPHAFGSAHLVAGKGREAMASSLAMIGTGLIGPTLGPLFVGAISDWATRANWPNGLGLGLMIVPVAALLTAVACLVADRRIVALLVWRATEGAGQGTGASAP